MLLLIGWYAAIGLLSNLVVAFAFLPGNERVPKSLGEFVSFCLCAVLWPLILIDCYGPKETEK